jgi:hypothetical protein
VPEQALAAYLPVSLTEAYLKWLGKARAGMLTRVASRPQWMNQLTLLKAVKSEIF